MLFFFYKHQYPLCVFTFVYMLTLSVYICMSCTERVNIYTNNIDEYICTFVIPKMDAAGQGEFGVCVFALTV